MINRNDWVEDFQKNFSELLARSPAADIERNMKAFMAQTFSRLDLVTREEFDVQVQLLDKALQRITALESRLAQLDGVPMPHQAAGPASTDTPAGDLKSPGTASYP
ncbi:MAG TPA: accessory factor UbiK family protein [Burkholderiaceae bacterium]|jgi:BMFP domain-containing protein YqiC|nr:accessory factor UbiK family protein [Burkholderiaceae bacterium]